ncbi:MAG: hypothetical protein M0R80_29380, partial [Proteobacteria bacterium]|nr:hypothetical protein [Pseudomonadota bacterium]
MEELQRHSIVSGFRPQSIEHPRRSRKRAGAFDEIIARMRIGIPGRGSGARTKFNCRRRFGIDTKSVGEYRGTNAVFMEESACAPP